MIGLVLDVQAHCVVPLLIGLAQYRSGIFHFRQGQHLIACAETMLTRNDLFAASGASCHHLCPIAIRLPRVEA
jgi:hypothetical protein